MMTEADDLTLTVTRLIPATPERVFNAWLDPKMLAQFMIAGSGMTCSEAVNDPRVGGEYRITMVDEEAIPHWGTYLDITRHSRISFTWNSRYAAKDSIVTLSFAPEQAGTRLTLKHVKFTSEGSRDGHAKGWTAIVDALERVTF